MATLYSSVNAWRYFKFFGCLATTIYTLHGLVYVNLCKRYVSTLSYFWLTLVFSPDSAFSCVANQHVHAVKCTHYEAFCCFTVISFFLGQMDFIAAFLFDFFFNIIWEAFRWSHVTEWCICWSDPTVCASNPMDKQGRHSQISAYIHAPFDHAVFIKYHFGTSSVVSYQAAMYIYSLVSVFCSCHVFGETAKIWILVKLTFRTAISSHQVMGMSLKKVWVMENIPRWIWLFSGNWLVEN